MMEYLTQIFEVLGILVYWGFAVAVLLLAVFGGEIHIQCNGVATVVRMILVHLQRKEVQ